MNLDEMQKCYYRAMGINPAWLAERHERFTVRLWDGMDGVWCDLPEATNVDLAFALRVWCEQTKNGTEKTSYGGIDYFAIFAADRTMLYSGGHTMFRGDEDDE